MNVQSFSKGENHFVWDLADRAPELERAVLSGAAQCGECIHLREMGCYMCQLEPFTLENYMACDKFRRHAVLYDGEL